MTDHSDDRKTALLKMARKLDEQLESGDDGEKLLDEMSLDINEKDELKRIQDALAFIKNGKLAKSKVVDSNELKTHPVADAETLGGSSGVDSVADDETSQFGRFQLSRILGEGGFARVWLAKDPTLDRPVAIKLLKSSKFFGEEVEARFEREAKAAAVLSHPNIVPVFETGVIENQRYIASAYCAGCTLEQWSKRQPSLDQRDSAKIVAALAEAVQHAHQRGVIHRDLKPANILVEDLGSLKKKLEERLKITDFGLAKQPASNDQLQTTEGAIVGTPAYMSPEQALGKTDIGAASDIYSLGVILYELLTGSVPHAGNSHVETLLAIKQNDVATPRRLNKDISRDLEAICLKCLNRKPSQRYESAHELAADLGRWLDGQAISARKITQVERLTKWCVRNPVLATSAVAVICALGMALWQWRSASSENRRAERHLATTQATINEMVSRIASNEQLPGDVRKDIAERAVSLQKSLLQEEPSNSEIAEQTSRAMSRFSKLLFDLIEHENALAINADQIALLESFRDEPFAKDHLFQAEQMRTGILRRMNRNEEAQTEIDRLESEAESEGELNKIARIKFQKGMNLLAGNADLPGAVAAFDEALACYEAAPEVFASEVARCYHFKGTALTNMNELDKGFELTQKSVEIVDDLLTKHPEKLELLEDWARCHVQLATIRSAATKIQEGGEREAAADDARQFFAKAANAYRNLIDRNPPNSRLPASVAVVFDLLIQMEIRLGNERLAGKAVDEFEEFLDQLSDETPYYVTIGRILVDRKLDWAEMAIDDNRQTAESRIQECQVLIAELEQQEASDPKLAMTKQRCEELLTGD